MHRHLSRKTHSTMGASIMKVMSTMVGEGITTEDHSSPEGMPIMAMSLDIEGTDLKWELCPLYCRVLVYSRLGDERSDRRPSSRHVIKTM